jgi:hypothetical protein
MKKEPGRKKPTLRERCKAAFNGVSRRELGGIFKETVKDLRKPKEIALLIGCSILPGGWIGYGVYRIARYRQRKAANDNPEGKQGPDAKSGPKTPPPPAPAP